MMVRSVSILGYESQGTFLPLRPVIYEAKNRIEQITIKKFVQDSADETRQR